MSTNSLPDYVVQRPSVDLFKAQMHKH